jgi:hypothetical protein
VRSQPSRDTTQRIPLQSVPRFPRKRLGRRRLDRRCKPDLKFGFDAKTDPFVEASTSLTWLAAKFPDVQLWHHMLGHSHRPQRSPRKWQPRFRCSLRTGLSRVLALDGAAAPPLPEVVPPVCIGANGEKTGLPLVGRIADTWHNVGRDIAQGLAKRDIVHASATDA